MKMLKTLVFVIFLHFGMLVTAKSYFYSNMKLCPSFKSQKNFDVNKMMGEWNLAILLTDEALEEYEDDSSCVRADFKKTNDTAFKQMWYMNSSQFGYGAIMELPTSITKSGEWIITVPLGGHLNVKVIHASPKTHLSLTFCGMQHGKSVHLWTAVVTRKTTITQIDFLELSAELLAQGFNINDSKMITWNKC